MLMRITKRNTAYESQITDNNRVSLIAIAYFDSVEEAALAGFTPDFNYIFNKVDTTYRAQ